MRRAVLLLAVLAGLWLIERGPWGPMTGPAAGSCEALVAAFEAGRSGLELECEGVVVRTLPDDTSGSRHQRFILEIAPRHTVLISHNIDLAARVDGLQTGDPVRFRGEYEYNDRGGVVHWTHADPQGRRPGGWIEHEGTRYR
jgi:hypothetical protein